MLDIEKLRLYCDKLSQEIFDKEIDFVETFSKVDGSELIHVRFSHSNVEFVVLAHSGAHILEYIT